MFSEAWVLDAPSAKFGYLECRTKKFKTANVVKNSVFLPLVAFANVFEQDSWADCWFKLREKLVDEFGDGFGHMFILPAVLRNNKWADRPMTTSEGSQALREILAIAGEPTDGISTHSLKATLLSWASKAHMSISDRRLLGHHVDKDEVSPLTPDIL